jgi:hypothetical protein
MKIAAAAMRFPGGLLDHSVTTSWRWPACFLRKQH